MTRTPPQSRCIVLTWLREHAGWTQRQLAKAAGISKAHSSAYERGTRQLSCRRLRQLAEIMGYTPSEVDLVHMVVVAVGREAEACEPSHPAAAPPLEVRYLRQTAAHLAVEVAGLAQPLFQARRAPGQDALARPSQALGIALSWLRQRLAWTQQDLAEAAGVPNSQISGYERGSRKLKRARFEGLVGAMDYTPAEADLALAAIAALGLARPGVNGSAVAGATAPLQACRGREAAAHLATEVAILTQSCIRAQAATHRIARARAEAGRLWQRLERSTSQERRLLVGHSLEYRTWALAERLAEKSARCARRSAAMALELARLASAAARIITGSDAWRSRLEGFTRAFLANALRVEGHLAQAGAEWQSVWRLWSEGATGDPTAILPEWRLLDLEASLRRDTRSFAAALDLLDRAMAGAPPIAAGRILLKRAVTLEQAGEATAALVTLQKAAPLVRALGEPALEWSLAFNWSVNLCHLGQFAEAAAQLPGLKRLTLDLGNELDLVRIGWLSGRVAGGMGDRQEARAAFERVREQLATHRNGFASAIVSLELAVLCLEDGQLAEVRRLAKEMSWIVAAEGVEREVLASLRLFCEAARREVATIDQARAALRLLGRSPRLWGRVP